MTGTIINTQIGANGYATISDDPDKELTGTCYPCNGILAATFNDPLIEEIGILVGEDAMWAGYAGIYGTGLNLHRSPYAGRVFEYYSEDSLLTGLMGAAWSKGVQSKGVYVYSKHMVLNDQEENRADHPPNESLPSGLTSASNQHSHLKDAFGLVDRKNDRQEG